MSESLDYALDRIMGELEVAGSWVYLRDSRRGGLVLAAQKGTASLSRRLALGEGAEGVVARGGEAALRAEDTSVPDGRTTFVAPLRVQNETLGTLGVSSVSAYLKGDVREFLEAIADELAAAVERVALREQERNALLELKASEQKYRDLFEKASEAILILDRQGRITAANESAARLTGYGVEELVSMTVRSFLQAGDEVLLQRAEGEGGPVEGALLRRDGARRAVQTSVAVVSSSESNGSLQLIIRDITEQKQLQQNLEQYIAGITRAQEEERKRIARDLHDDTAQALVTISREVDNLASQARLSRTVRQQIEEVRKLADQTLKDVRRFSQDLRPSVLDDLGLLPAVEWLTGRLERFGISPRTMVFGKPRRLAAEVELALFRIIQEALNNAVKHAQATEVGIEVTFKEASVAVVVRDNGKGFQVPSATQATAQGQLGLLGMRERAQLLKGNLDVLSAPGDGTTVRVEVPA